MEAYTSWWNWGTIQEMLDYNTKYSPIMDNWTLLKQGGLDMEGWTWLVPFRWNHVKLAWAFINIMNVVCYFGILCNDLSKDNIILHFLLNKLYVVYITFVIGVKLGICKRWHHHCMALPRNKMPPTQGKCIGRWP
jgi:hypothetical protein